MTKIKFGWNVSTAASNYMTGATFTEQILSVLNDIHAFYDSVWIYDHFHAPPFLADDYPRLEAWTTTAYLARAFPNLYFGNIVLGQSYRNPALVAKMVATLQALTNGKAILGIGAGWMESEYHAYGYEFPKPSVRVKQLEEAVQIIRMMWREKRATFEGDYYQVKGALCEPKPDPIPPIMIGGNGEKLTLRVVAKYADWWNGLSLDAEGMAHKLDILKVHCDDVGRDYDDITKTYFGIISIAETEAQAKQITSASPRRDTTDFEGTPAQVIDQLQAYVDLGFSYFMLDFNDFPNSDGSQLFAEEVIPAFS